LSDAELDAIFAKIDKDGNKTLDKAELGLALSQTGKLKSEVDKFLRQLGDDFKPLTSAEFKDVIRGKGELGKKFSGQLSTTLADLSTETGLRKLFDEIDRDKGGTIDKFELMTALNKLGKPRSEVSKIMAELGDDFKPLTFEEFRELMMGQKKKRADMMSAAGLDKLFDEIDRDKGGTIDKFELLNALDRLGKTKEEVQTIVASLGGNFKPLTKDDFKNLMLGPAVVVEGRQH